MPIFLIIIGILLIDVAIKGTYSQFFGTIKNIILGSNTQKPFWKWGLAIIVVASIGYYDKARPIAVAIIVLIFVVMLAENNSKTLSVLQNVTNNL